MLDYVLSLGVILLACHWHKRGCVVLESWLVLMMNKRGFLVSIAAKAVVVTQPWSLDLLIVIE